MFVTMMKTAESLLAMARGYQTSCVLAAAADLDLFNHLGRRSLPATSVARQLRADLRATTILLDALAALGLLTKRANRYAVPAAVRAVMPHVLPMLQHQANCLRRWSQLAATVKSGWPPRRVPSVRGAAADYASFIGAMHVINADADRIIRGVRPLRFRHLLDVGGASGTWTIAFLRACPGARATLVDLPQVIPLARQRLAAAGLRDRVELVAGDYTRDALPGGADLAWVSAIVHQNSRAENRRLFRKVYRALVPGGRIAIRDIVMEPSRTQPVMGALFAVNMLVGTDGGGTFTLPELRADLTAAGFRAVKLAQPDPGMNAIVLACRP